MKLFTLVLSMALIASPCFAGSYPKQGDLQLVASAQGSKKKVGREHGGKVVIKGKGGKVTDVDKKTKKKGKKSE